MSRSRYLTQIQKINLRMPKRRESGKIAVYQYRFDDPIEPRVSYADYRDNLIKQILEGTYGNMRVNSEGFPKTNTNEPRYKHLCKMVKEGYLILKRTNSISRYWNSAHTYMVLNKDKINVG